MFTDSHAHLTDPQLFSQIEGIVKRAQENGVARIVNICMTEEGLNHGLALSQKYPWIFNAAAIHPHDAGGERDNFFRTLEQHTKHLVAIGETGLDYHYTHSTKEAQRESLLRHIALAARERLPLIFHCRDAFADLFAFTGKPKAVLHCFTGTLEEAKECLDRGWMISFSGVITFKKSEALREVVAYTPLERMFIETDAPFLAPQSKRGKLNEPSYIHETAACIAAVKGIAVEAVAAATASNAQNFFTFPSVPL